MNLKVEFGDDYIAIYLIHSNNDGPYDAEEIVYWTKEEWIEDPETVVPAIANAIHLAHTNPKKLCKLVGKVRG